ncbi:MAG: BamA/TamA family outer membrane protein [candidate division WOR-3 bacterium]
MGKFRQSWGFGFRWTSPIGPLRFEWGFPLHPQEGEQNQVFEFGMGSFF